MRSTRISCAIIFASPFSERVFEKLPQRREDTKIHKKRDILEKYLYPGKQAVADCHSLPAPSGSVLPKASLWDNRESTAKKL
jgi:hypothetical protein